LRPLARQDLIYAQASISYVALAWAIQSEATPVQDMHNPIMNPARLQILRDAWLPRNLDTLDDSFDYYPYPPPV